MGDSNLAELKRLYGDRIVLKGNLHTTEAMLSPDAFRFYHALNLPLKSLYGTTEGGALTGAKNNDIHLETVGPAHPGTEVKITDAGEIIYRQPGVFMGYYQDPEKTAQVGMLR